ncbi:MAG: NUDIX hydrolase [Pseudomonadota bacterium]
MSNQRPIVAVGGVVLKGDEVLLIQRGRQPLKGHWSIPGGKVEQGEALEDAVVREILEETGCTVEVLGLIDVFESLPEQEGDRHFVMVDYACRYVSGTVEAADDAMDAAFLPLAEALSRVAWDETRRAVQGALRFR